jgi:hypothetical protein
LSMVNHTKIGKVAVKQISNEFKRSQIRAAVKINDEMLRFYWKLGKDISTMSKQ